MQASTPRWQYEFWVCFAATFIYVRNHKVGNNYTTTEDWKNKLFISEWYASEWSQGTLIEGKGYVQLTSSIR